MAVIRVVCSFFLYTASQSSPEDLPVPVLSFSGSNGVSRSRDRDSIRCLDDHAHVEEKVSGEDSEEDTSQSSKAALVDWLPKLESGQKNPNTSTASRMDGDPNNHLSNFLLTCHPADGAASQFTCTHCSYTCRLTGRAQQHSLKLHQTTSFKKTPRRQSVESHAAKKLKQGGDSEDKVNDILTKFRARIRKSSRQTGNLKTKRQRRRKEPVAEDKRFLSNRPIRKTFTEDETKCAKCDKVFEHPNQLKTHVRLHSFPYSCIQCEKGFTSLSGYYQHQRLHKKGRNFTCGKCKKTFLCSYSLRQHERLHEGPSTLCNVCGKGFSKTGITRHMRMHLGKRNYLCTTCGKCFLSSGELLLHTRSHTGETPYTCVRCGKGFSCKSHLNVHMRSHTGERPYLCAECPKRFLTQNCLKRHRLSHNGVKPFKCPGCGREFSQRGNMNRHMATHKQESSM